MRALFYYRFRLTTLQLWLFISFLLGIGAAHSGNRLSIVWPLVLGFISGFGFYKKSIFGLVLIILFGLSLGWWRGTIFMDKLAAYQPYYEHNQTLILSAMQDGVYGKQSQMTFDGNNIVMSDGNKMAGKVAVSGYGVNAIFQGDSVAISGKLRTGYGAKQATLSFAKLTVLAHHNSLIAEIRRRFAAGMQSALPEPLGSFAMGLLIGQRATLPDNVKQDLLMVGLTHIIAVSGYNLTIMLHASRKLLANQSKRLATWFSFLLIGVFLLLAGGSASIIRAAIVSSLSIVTNFYGRRMKPLNIITLAAALTAFANPFYVWSDISWYLSFLAFFGVMILAPLVTERLPFRHNDSVILGVAIESLSAETMSLPIVLFTFGQMSLIGLLANVMVVALVPIAMLFCAIAGLAGMVMPLLAGWIVWPANILLNYMLDVAHLLASLPHIFVEHLAVSLMTMLLWYAGLMTYIGALWFKSGHRSAMITDIGDEPY